jgi:hypothetical protein
MYSVVPSVPSLLTRKTKLSLPSTKAVKKDRYIESIKGLLASTASHIGAFPTMRSLSAICKPKTSTNSAVAVTGFVV